MLIPTTRTETGYRTWTEAHALAAVTYVAAVAVGPIEAKTIMRTVHRCPLRDVLALLDAAHARLQILEEDEGRRGRLQRQRPCRGTGGFGPHGLIHAFDRRDVGTLEQPHPDLHPQHAADGVVDQIERHLAALDQLGEVGGIRARGHVEVEPGEEGLARGVPQVGRDALADELSDAAPFADDDAVETPLTLRDIAGGGGGRASGCRRRR